MNDHAAILVADEREAERRGCVRRDQLEQLDGKIEQGGEWRG